MKQLIGTGVGGSYDAVGSFGAEPEFGRYTLSGAGLDLLSDYDEVAGFKRARCDLVVPELAVSVPSFLVEEIKQVLLLSKQGERRTYMVEGVLTFPGGSDGCRYCG